MSYEGEVIGVVEATLPNNRKPFQPMEPITVEVRQMTDSERGGRKQHYLLKGMSHWNPASFFSRHADELEARAAAHRAAYEVIMAEEERRATTTSAYSAFCITHGLEENDESLEAFHVHLVLLRRSQDTGF